MAGYFSFARFYDGLMEDARYEDRCRYLLELAERHNHDMGITLDLACGTGTLTELFAQNGVDVFGIDASAEMLSEAIQKSAEKGLNILYLKQKMQNIDLYGTINTCICTLDGINHMTDINDVARTFDRVGLFMDDGGLCLMRTQFISIRKSLLTIHLYMKMKMCFVFGRIHCAKTIL